MMKKYTCYYIFLILQILFVDLKAQTAPCYSAATNYSNFIFGFPQCVNMTNITNADVNNDGNNDLLITYVNTNNVGVFFGSASGFFTFSGSYSVGVLPAFSGINPVDIVCKDFNNDGLKDFAVVNYNSQDFTIRKGIGSGLFGAAVTFTLGGQCERIYSGDFNSDGFQDLCMLGFLSLKIALNNGSGNFPTAVTYTPGTQFKSATVGNFNADTNLDILVVNSSSDNVILLSGSPSGTFAATNTINTIGGSAYIASADFDGDSDQDFAISRLTTKDISIFKGNGTGSFSLFASMQYTPQPYKIIADEMNNDGNVDLIVSSGHVQIFKGLGTGNFSSPNTYAGAPNFLNITCGDFNADGFKDISGKGDQERIYNLFNIGNGNLKDVKIHFGSTLQSNFSNHVAGDFNNDGLTDAVGFDYNTSRLETLLNAGNDNFASVFTYTASAGGIASGQALHLNSDNYLDLFFVTGFGDLYMMNGDGTGSFSVAATWSTNVPAGFTYTIDLNNDNLIDLAYQNMNGIIFNVNGGNNNLPSGSFIYPNPMVADMTSGDFNNDGLNDAALSFQTQNYFNVYLNNGSGFTFVTPTTFTSTTGPIGIAAGDFDEDGNCDIISGASLGVDFYKGNGTGNFNAPITLANTFGTYATIKAIDMNGDGHLDVVTNNYWSTVSVMYGNGNGTFSPWTNIVTKCGHIQIHDFNNDNALDISTSSGVMGIIYGGYLPKPILGPNKFCGGSGPITLSTTASPGTFTWNTASTATSIVVQPTVTSIYSLIGSNLLGCPNSTSSKTITVNAPPTLSVSTNNSIICTGFSSTLTCTGANSYTWTSSWLTPSMVVTPSITSTFTVVGMDLNGCTSTASITQAVANCTGNFEYINSTNNRIYPNPTNGKVIFDLEAEYSLSVFSLLGELQFSSKLDPGSNIIQFGDLPNGIYIVSLRNSTNEQMVRLILDK